MFSPGFLCRFNRGLSINFRKQNFVYEFGQTYFQRKVIKVLSFYFSPLFCCLFFIFFNLFQECPLPVKMSVFHKDVFYN